MSRAGWAWRRATALALGWLVAAATPAAELHPVALRIAGQLTPYANGWNLVEGRELSGPQAVAVDATVRPPRLYVADTGNHRVLGWRDSSGFASGAPADVVLGQPNRFGASPNSPSVALGLLQPSGIAVDPAGNLYVADTGNNRVLRFPRPFDRRIPVPDLAIGQPSLVARDRNQGGPVSPSTLASPGAVACNARGDLAVADTGNRRVLLFAAGDLVSNGAPASATLGSDTLAGPAALAFDAAGRLYVADPLTNRVLQYAGATIVRALGIGPGASFRPSGLAVVGEDLLVADGGNHRLLVFHPGESAAGAVFGQPDLLSGVAKLPSARSLSSPAQLATAPDGTLFVADSGNHRVLALPRAGDFYIEAARVLGQDDLSHGAPNLLEGREVSTSHALSTPAGGVPAAGGIVVDTRRSPSPVYVADTANHRVLAWRDVRFLREGRRADLVIGQPDFGTALANYGSPAASASNLNRPAGLALDRDGNLLVADSGNHRILRFPNPFEQPAGGITADLVIGQPSLSGLPAQGASAYLLNRPTGLALHPETGDLLVADTLNNRVLHFAAPLASGMAATRVLGQVSFEESGRGVSSTTMTSPTDAAFDADGRIYVADTGNSRVLIFGPVKDLPARGAAALASGAAPLGQPDFATSAGATANNRLRNPTSLRVDWETGDLWVADTGNHRVVRFPPLAVLAFNGGAAYAAGGLFGQTTFTGRTANLGAATSGQTSAAGLNLPNALALDAAGNLLVGDANARVALYFPKVAAVSAATFLPGAPLAPGMVAALFGTDLSAASAAGDLPLPATLADVQLLVNDAPAPLFYVSPGQINFQVPAQMEAGTVARLEVVRASSGQVLAGGTVALAPAAPGLFGVLNEDGSLNTPDRPAARNSTIQIFATGQGAVNRPPRDGEPAPSQPMAETPAAPLVTIGTSGQRDVVPEFSGLAPGLVGLWQINARVPDATVPSGRTPVLVRYAGAASNVVYIAVR